MASDPNWFLSASSVNPRTLPPARSPCEVAYAPISMGFAILCSPNWARRSITPAQTIAIGPARDKVADALLRYCKRDTLAMVMIYEAWRKWIRRGLSRPRLTPG